MAEATFIGRTKLDTTGMRAGFARVKEMSARTARDLNRAGGKTTLAHAFGDFQRSAASAFVAVRFQLKAFNRDVTQNVLKAASAFSRLAKGAALAGGAVAAIGVSKSFKTEALEAQFAVIMGDADAARKKVKELQAAAANTAFDPNDYIAAYKTLLTTSNGELATGSMMQGIGDAAAVAGKQVNDVATEVSMLYNSLKSGRGGGGAARNLLKDSIITFDTFKYILEHGKDAANAGEVFARVQKDLQKFAGGMDRIKNTGSGAFAVLRNMTSLALEETFRGVASVFKDIAYNLSTFIRGLQTSGSLAKFGSSIANAFSSIVNNIYAAIQAFRNMDTASQTAFRNLLVGITAVAGLQYAGILGPLLKAVINASGIIMRLITNISLFALGNIGLITGAIAGVGTALVGFNLGNAIFGSLGDTGKKIVESVATILEAIGEMIWGWFRVQVVPLGKAIWDAISNPKDFSFSKVFEKLKSSFLEEFGNASENAKKTMRQLDAIWQMDSDPAQSFGEAWEQLPKKVGGIIGEIIGKIKNINLDDLMKIPGMEGIAKWIKEFQKLENIKLPKPPDFSRARKDTEAMAEASRKSNAYTIRGYYFRTLNMRALMDAAKKNGQLAEHNRKKELDAQRKAAGKVTTKPIETELKRSNRLLEEIKRNTGKASGAVYA